MALALGLTRAFVRSESATIGNFWVDLTRSILYVLLPLSILTALVFVALGIPQTLQGSIRGDDAGGREANDRNRSGGQPGGDQAARQQWRWVLQRKFGASVRKPQRVVEHGRVLEPARSSRRLRLRFRPHGGRSSPRTQPVGRDGNYLHRQPRDHLSKRSRGQSVVDGDRRRSFRRQSGRQGSAFRAGGRGAIRHRHDRNRDGRRQCDLRFAHADRRSRSDAQSPDGLHRSGRGRHWTLCHPSARYPLRLPGRADGRAARPNISARRSRRGK